MSRAIPAGAAAPARSRWRCRSRCRCDRGQPHRCRRSRRQRGAVEEERGGEGPEQEVLERGLLRQQATAPGEPAHADRAAATAPRVRRTWSAGRWPQGRAACRRWRTASAGTPRTAGVRERGLRVPRVNRGRRRLRREGAAALIDANRSASEQHGATESARIVPWRNSAGPSTTTEPVAAAAPEAIAVPVGGGDEPAATGAPMSPSSVMRELGEDRARARARRPRRGPRRALPPKTIRIGGQRAGSRCDGAVKVTADGSRARAGLTSWSLRRLQAERPGTVGVGSVERGLVHGAADRGVEHVQHRLRERTRARG